MKRVAWIGGVAFLALAVWLPAARAEEPAPLGTVTAVSGTVEVGKDGVWQAVAVKQNLFDGQTLRTAEKASLEILFEGQVPAKLGEKSEIAVADLLLKARLEQTKAKISVPSDDNKAEMQVTPMTGVRGTEKTEEKAEDLKREHYWNETAPAAK